MRPLHGIRKTSAFLGATLLPLGFWQCQQVDPLAERAVFRIDGDSVWQDYDPLIIVIASIQGDVIDTLFRGQLDSLNELWHLAAPHYDGGQVMVAIYGYVKGQLKFSQGRKYDGLTQRVIAIEPNIPVMDGNLVATNPSVPTPADTNKQKPTTPTPADTAKPGEAPPKIVSAQTDTTVSIRDIVPLTVRVESGVKRITFVAWDYESDGKNDDSLKSPTGSVFSAKPRYAEAGDYTCTFTVRTAFGQAKTQISIHVVLDPPVADAGEDTTVAPGAIVLLHAKGSDGFGPIVKREWQFDGGAFKSVSQQETKMTAPLEIGDYDCVLRITDSDGLTALDTMILTVDDAVDVP